MYGSNTFFSQVGSGPDKKDRDKDFEHWLSPEKTPSLIYQLHFLRRRGANILSRTWLFTKKYTEFLEIRVLAPCPWEEIRTSAPGFI